MSTPSPGILTTSQNSHWVWHIHPLFKISELKHIPPISEGLIMIPALKTIVASLCLGGLVAVLSPLVTPASAAQLQRCASENGVCQLPYPAEVVYGTGGQNTSRFIDRPQVTCSNRVFGDPAPGKRKAVPSWFRTVGTDRIVRAALIAPVVRIVMATVTMIGTATGPVARMKAGSANSTVASVSVTAQMAASRKASSAMASNVTTAPSAIQPAEKPSPATCSTKRRTSEYKSPDHSLVRAFLVQIL